MSVTLHLAALETYAKEYAQKLCDSHFAEHDRITGPQLLQWSTVPQVNMFIIRDLYEKWRATAIAFESPYFDFTHENVQTALRQFLNVVSQHISVARPEIEPLLENATVEALNLTLEPQHYYEGLLREMPDFQLKKESLDGLLKYARIHRNIPIELSQNLGDQESVYTTQALGWLEAAIAKEGTLDGTEATLTSFSEMLPFDKEQFYKKPASAFLWEEPVAAVATPKEELNFFDSLMTTPEKNVVKEVSSPVPIVETQTADALEPVVVSAEERPLPVFETPEAIVPEPAIAPIEERQLPVFEAPALVIPEPVVGPVEERPLPVFEAPAYAPVSPEPVVEHTQNINERFATETAPSLNDRLIQDKPSETLIEQFQNKPIDSVHSYISLNHRFIFINQLFHGDSVAYHHAVEDLEKCGSFEQAKDLMNRVYAPKYLWRMAADEADEFYEIVRRRFNGNQ